MLKAGALGDNTNKPSQRNSSSTAKIDSVTAPFDETPKASPQSKVHPVDWFHRLQMEGLGIWRRPDAENKAKGEPRNR